MLHRLAVLLLAAVLTQLPVGARAQAPAAPGGGQLNRLTSESVAADARSHRFADLEGHGRVRAVRILAARGSAVIQRIVITYANGQVHYEDREIRLAQGEQTRPIDPRFEERRISSVEVVLKPGERAGPVTLEVWAAQAPTEGAGIKVGRPRTAYHKRTAPAEPAPEAARGPVATRGAIEGLPYTELEVFYGTDRKPEPARKMPGNIELGSFGPEPAQRLMLGRAVVTIPKARKPGTIPRPEFSLLITSIRYRQEDLARDFTLLAVNELDRAAFAAAIRARTQDARTFKDQAFVFVHGFNVSFDDALFRTAQIAHDMGFDGLPLAYSWPSVAQPQSYLLDRDRAREARATLPEFLDLVGRDSGAKVVHLIAHSMGAHALLEAIERLVQGTPAAAVRPPFGELVFAAPDILSEDFAATAQRLRGVGRGMTLYASSNDWALRASDWARLGRSPAGTVPASGVPVITAGVDSIDVTRLNTSYFSLNHGAFGDHETLLKDMGDLLLGGVRPPDQRTAGFKPKPAPRNAGIFWRFE